MAPYLTILSSHASRLPSLNRERSDPPMAAEKPSALLVWSIWAMMTAKALSIAIAKANVFIVWSPVTVASLMMGTLLYLTLTVKRDAGS